MRQEPAVGKETPTSVSNLEGRDILSNLMHSSSDIVAAIDLDPTPFW
jgi:hypothetical protein